MRCSYLLFFSPAQRAQKALSPAVRCNRSAYAFLPGGPCAPRDPSSSYPTHSPLCVNSEITVSLRFKRRADAVLQTPLTIVITFSLTVPIHTRRDPPPSPFSSQAFLYGSGLLLTPPLVPPPDKKLQPPPPPTLKFHFFLMHSRMSTPPCLFST